jgi:hypothetical protein
MNLRTPTPGEELSLGGTDQILFSWDAETGATAYEFYRVQAFVMSPPFRPGATALTTSVPSVRVAPYLSKSMSGW